MTDQYKEGTQEYINEKEQDIVEMIGNVNDYAQDVPSTFWWFATVFEVKFALTLITGVWLLKSVIGRFKLVKIVKGLLS